MERYVYLIFFTKKCIFNVVCFVKCYVYINGLSFLLISDYLCADDRSISNEYNVSDVSLNPYMTEVEEFKSK